MESIDIETNDGMCDAVIFKNANADSAVLFFMDAYGIRPALLKMAKEIYELGYTVLVPNLLYRMGKAPVIENLEEKISKGETKDIIDAVLPQLRGLTPDDIVRDITSFIECLSQYHKIGVIGYCFGGGVSLRAACHFPEKIKIAASFHGGNLASESETSPHKELKSMETEFYFAHADHDSSMPPEQIERLEKTLKENDLKFESVIYREAKHGFTMSDLPVFNKEAKKRHDEKLKELFKRAL